ncbi:MAG: YbhN family protein, partial [Planctomycetota bacterium]
MALVLLLLFGTWILTAWRWAVLLRAAEIPLPFLQVVRLNLVGAFFNLAVPGATGGDVVKAWYAARATKRGVRAFLSVFVDRLVGLVGLAFFAALALFAGPSRAGYGPARLVVLVALAGLLLGGTILLSRRLRRWLGLAFVARRLPFRGFITEAGAALALYRKKPGALAFSLLLSLSNHAIAGTVVWLLARALDIQGLDLPTVLALVPVANLFGVIPLLPGGWGVGEVAFAYFFGQVGVPATEAVSLSVVYRLGMLVVSLPGGALWLFLR